MEVVLSFTAGTVVGLAVKSVFAYTSPTLLIPPPPPPLCKRPRAKIFFGMKDIKLPLAEDGEDIRGIIDSSTTTTVKIETTPKIKISDDALATVSLKKAPPLMSVEEKRATFFQPPRPIFVELLQRLQTLHPQQ